MNFAVIELDWINIEMAGSE